MKGVSYKLFWLLLSIVLYPLSHSHAQYDNVWAFGINAGIDFNFTPPRAIKTAIQTNEGSASISDTSGQLLFYTDGTDVWDRNNNIMPNGRNLLNLPQNVTSSTSQGTLIVPIPGGRKQYYVFSLGCWECDTNYSGNLYYSLIDMNLNNGLGDAVTGNKGMLLDVKMTERMTAVSGDNCDVWLLTIRRAGGFKAYNIDFNGLDTHAVVSPSILGPDDLFFGYPATTGTIDVAPDRKKLASAQGNLVLYDFDPASGIVSNPLVLDDDPYLRLYGYYGVAFSPDNSKLYASNGNDGSLRGIYQFNLSLNNTNAIKASKTPIATTDQFFYLKRGPDGKIYCAVAFLTRLAVINQPNLVGAACEYVYSGFSLFSGTRIYIGFPNSAILMTRKIYNSNADTALCDADSLLLRPNNPNGHDYLWENGSTNQDRYVYEPGIYWLTYQHALPGQCEEYYVDTFKIAFPYRQGIFTTTTYDARCKTDTILMQPRSLDGYNYLWEDGTGVMERKINKTGTYWIRYQNDALCEFYTDSFRVTYPDPEYRVSFMVDTLICHNDTVLFKNTSNAHFNEFNWSFGDGDTTTSRTPMHGYQEIGTYQVQLIGRIDSICPDTASVTIIVDPVIPFDFVTDRDTICVGESISFSPRINSNTLVDLQWDFGDGRQFTTLNESSIQHAYDHAGEMQVQLSANFRACPDSSFTDGIQVFAIPEVYLGSDSGLCFRGTPILLQNLRHTEAAAYLWNTGDTTAVLKVVHPGMYCLKVSKVPLGCSTTEAIEIKKDCYIDIPNAFTPDGDGINDYFFPRQLLAQNVHSFKMQVFNRWGQIMFETTALDGRGWNGIFNDIKQPQGVYVYWIEVGMDGKWDTERYRGNLTLLR